MNFSFSDFALKFQKESGILKLMDDLGRAMHEDKNAIMMGGGNPAFIPQMQKLWRDTLHHLLTDDKSIDMMLGAYDTPQGKAEFLKILTEFYHRNFHWSITEKNIAITNGSQNAFFYLFNSLAGKFENSFSSFKKILFPLAPEYIGYMDLGLNSNQFYSLPPKIEITAPHRFKYYINFDLLKKELKENSKNIGALCVSRPTNPSGNVLTNEEIEKLNVLSKEYSIPLIIDNAYGAPFPYMLFKEIKTIWDQNIILTMSLSKMGLPGVRTGIVIANEEIIRLITSLNAIISLSSGSIGPALTIPLFRDDSIIHHARSTIRDYYQKKSLYALQKIKSTIPDFIPYSIHESEGALFLWMCFDELKITSGELYEQLKKEKAIVVPGHYFFTDIKYHDQKKNCNHKDKCVRINYAREKNEIDIGIEILSALLVKLYK